jgi:hypothetical protein
MLAVSGECDAHEAQCELYLAAAQAVRALEWPFSTAQVAGPAEWQAGMAAARNAADAVIAAIRWRVRRSEPGAEVLAAAKLADESCIYPEEILIELCAKVAQARARPRVRT